MSKKTEIIKGYKIFDANFQCRRHQYSENSEHKFDGEIVICSTGLHFCLKASDCFSYYDFKPENIVCEVEALGEVKYHDDDTKAVTNHLKIGRRLTWQEVLFIANEGKDNTGHSNSGNRNSGDRNSGYSNSGNRNSGDRNSGYRNSGYSNSGDRNSGNWNSGNRNSGDSNSGYRNSGAFCLDPDPILYLFDKPTKIKVKEWENSKAVQIMNQHLDQTMWIPWSAMSEDEKKANPKFELQEGYLKTIPLKDAWSTMWHNLSDENKKVFTDLENFDSKIFFSITGIKA